MAFVEPTDDQISTVVQNVKDTAGPINLSGIDDTQIKAQARLALIFVASIGAPNDVVTDLAVLWTLYRITAQGSQFSSIKLNNAEVEKSSTSSNSWLREFWALAEIYGIGSTKVTGF